MRRFLPLLLLAATLPAFAQTALAQTAPAPPPGDRQAEIEAFNQRFAAATRSMDNAATLALWADDGISLLPSTDPILGKPALAAFLDKVVSSLPGAHMEKFEMECHDLLLSGNLATEWCAEHQVVAIPNKPSFDGRGRMLLVLHRSPAGHWLLEREMWIPA